jgi:RimJ/RimL family protein N-acetyltransferase
MAPLPVLETERLVLRAFALSDAPEVRRLVGAREVAATTLAIPHPYTTSMAEEWIERHTERRDSGEALHWAITSREDGALLGAIGLEIEPAHARGELGYWIGVPYWRRGYCTEAGQAVVRHAFGVCGLNRIVAYHFGENIGSGRVMHKLGMTQEGVLRQHVKKWGRYVDLVCYGLLRTEWERSSDLAGQPGADPSTAEPR